MGDGVLFIFPDDGDPTTTCNRAVMAVQRLVKGIHAQRDESGLAIRFGCALHFGEVLVTHYWRPLRLDFTVLGQAVVLRLDWSRSRVNGESCVLSSRFASWRANQLER